MEKIAKLGFKGRETGVPWRLARFKVEWLLPAPIGT